MVAKFQRGREPVTRVDLEVFGLKTLRDPAACRYVNTPSADDTAANLQLPIFFLPSHDTASRRFLNISFLFFKYREP